MLFARRRPDRLLGRRLGGLTASAALHAAAILVATWSPDSRPAGEQASAAPRPSPVIAVVPSVANAGAQPDTLPRRPSLELAGIAVDLEKLGGTPAELFPFVQWEPLAPRDAAAPDDGTRRLRNPLLGGLGASARAPLHITDRQLQAIVDRAWSRRERWRPFAPIMAMATTSDGDHGRAAELLRAYADQNLLQPYYDGDTLDARYWTMLGLAADHRVFLERVTAYLRERPRSKVAVELLFLLDELVQGSRDTLLMVTGNDPEAALRRSAAEQPEAYARAQRLFADTRTWLKGAGLNEPGAIRRRLDDVRLHLLTLVVNQAPDGYRAADAHYLTGVIHFEQRQRERAAAEWSRAVTGPGDLYAEALAEVRAALLLPPERRVAAVVAALGAEHGRWLDSSERRLRQFGSHGTAF